MALAVNSRQPQSLPPSFLAMRNTTFSPTHASRNSSVAGHVRAIRRDAHLGTVCSRCFCCGCSRRAQRMRTVPVASPGALRKTSLTATASRKTEIPEKFDRCRHIGLHSAFRPVTVDVYCIQPTQGVSRIYRHDVDISLSFTSLEIRFAFAVGKLPLRFLRPSTCNRESKFEKPRY